VPKSANGHIHPGRDVRGSGTLIALIVTKGISMAKPNYQFEKRQRELEKKKKKEEKLAKRAAPSDQTVPAAAPPNEPVKE
jgi:hypothetical protein